MTISGALSNAMSGLRAAGRASETISSNISNVMTEGYGRRILALSPNMVGSSGGVSVDGIIRISDPVLIADRRLADADYNNARPRTDFFAGLESLMGDPESSGSLSARLAQLDTSLIAAESRPDLVLRLDASVTSARDLAKSIKSVSAGLQDMRSNADRAIDTQVNRLNEALQQVQELNSQITASFRNRGAERAALLDHRQQIIDEIGGMVPIREVPRDHGTVALYTTGGAILLDGPAARLEFTPTPVITPYMTIDLGLLSGLTINGLPVRTGSDNGVLRGGSIGAQFEIRDELSVTAQLQMDALARDLVERFQDPGTDPTLAIGDAGLFTDGGLSFDPVNEIGLSGRIRINAAVDAQQGGEAWRMRTGLNAAGPGEPGDATMLSSLRDALSDARIPLSGTFGPGAASALDLVTQLVSRVGSDHFTSEKSLSFSATSLNTLSQMELEAGVDTDAELQHLMVVEQAYAANARVIAAVDEMMQSILRL